MFRKSHSSTVPVRIPAMLVPLPFSVRFGLTHNGGQVKRQGIESLCDPIYQRQRLGFYLLMKAASNNDAEQKALLQLMASRQYDLNSLSLADARPILDRLEATGPIQVQAKKVAEVARKGTETWAQAVEASIEVVDKTPRELFALAHSSLIGFDILARHTLQKDRPLYILKPERFQQDTEPVGFQLTSLDDGALQIDDLAPDFTRPAEAYLFDDISNTGATFAAALAFWGTQTQPSVTIPTLLTTGSARQSIQAV